MYPLPKTCNASTLKAERVDDLVWKTIIGLAQDPEAIVSHIDKYQQKRLDGKKADNEEIESAERALKTLNHEEERIFRAYKVGAITLGKYQREQGQLDGTRAEYEKRLKEISSVARRYIPKPILLVHMKRFCTELGKKQKAGTDFQERQRLVRQLVQKAVLDKQQLALSVVGFWTSFHEGVFRVQQATHSASGIRTARVEPSAIFGSHYDIPKVPLKIGINLKTGEYAFA